MFTHRSSFQTLARLATAAASAAILMAMPIVRADAGPQAPSASPHNTLTPAEKAAGWRLLFDGNRIDQWRGFKSQTLPEGWQAVNGALTRVRPATDIITKEQFGDFDLMFDWQLGPRGNSGVMFYVTENAEATYHSGPEYQLLDNAAYNDGKSIITSTASCYALYPPSRDLTRPLGEWNQSRIVANRGRVQHWLNGEKVVEYDMNSDDWKARVLASKFKEWPVFGVARRGHLAIQEHDSQVAFRNLKIRTLN